MRSPLLWSLSLLLVPICPLAAQRADSAGPAADSLRHRIEERFASRVQQDLGLNNDQTAKLKATGKEFAEKRRQLRDRQRQLREALRAQLQPGVAANQDSVAKLTDAMVDLRVTMAQTSRDEMKQMSKYLNPLQRARLLVMRERLHSRMKEVREHRGMYGKGGRDRWKDHPE